MNNYGPRYWMSDSDDGAISTRLESQTYPMLDTRVAAK